MLSKILRNATEFLKLVAIIFCLMQQKRQLAAIMFTDIEGYSALMQGDEAQAIHLRAAHRKIFNSTTEKYGGKILQYYGDGTLSIFDSAIAAVECGIELQLAFQKSPNSIADKIGIPVRIGIHSGDIIYSEEDIIGDSVNVASRIESLATVGSVFISDKVFDEIKNQASIETQSMGWFELKNVVKPVEVFAISNEGLVVPDPNQIQGKARKVEAPISPNAEMQDNFFKSLWNRGHPQLIAGYFVGVWGLVEFVDWLLNRYQISPYWTEVLLVFFLSLLPSLLLFVWNRDRLLQGKVNLLEKFIFPGNLAASILLLFIVFKGTDLGATTKTVSFNNEDGIEQSRTIIKPDFRKKLAIHNFIPEKEDSLHQWMGWGVHSGVSIDIGQNGYLTVGTRNRTQSLQEMISEGQEEFYSHSLRGSYAVLGDTYQITTKLYNTQSGALSTTHTFRGRDFFTLIDSISIVTKKDLELTQKQREQFVDLPFTEAFTSNIEAYKNYSLFFWTGQIKHLEQAIAFDSTFALANFVLAQYLYGSSVSVLGAKEAIHQGMRHRKRLPENLRSRLKTLYFQINDQPEKAIALLKMQLEMNPGNNTILETLTQYFYLTASYEELLAWRRKLATLDPEPYREINVAEALVLNGRFEEAGQTIFKILDRYPNHRNATGSLATYYALTGQFHQADSFLQKIIIQNPEFEPLAKHYLAAFQYAKEHLPTPESLIKYKGLYKHHHNAAEYDINIIGSVLLVKGRAHMKAWFMLPSAPDEFILGDDYFLEKWKFASDTFGLVYNLNAWRLERNNQIFNNVLWRQDSLIKKAMGLFSLDKQKEALEAFRIAYHQNPQHFYLAEYIRHLKFVLNPNNKKALENIKKYVGRYGPRHIWMEHDKFYYRREGLVSKQRLLPLSPDRFYFWGGFHHQMQVVVKNGEVQGTVSWEYNHDTGEFVRNDEDFIAFDELKD